MSEERRARVRIPPGRIKRMSLEELDQVIQELEGMQKRLQREQVRVIESFSTACEDWKPGDLAKGT